MWKVVKVVNVLPRHDSVRLAVVGRVVALQLEDLERYRTAIVLPPSDPKIKSLDETPADLL